MTVSEGSALLKVRWGKQTHPAIKENYPFRRVGSGRCFRTQTIMIKNPAILPPMPGQPPGTETEQQHFDRILSRDQFKPLKAILDELHLDHAVMRGAIVTTNSYPNFLGKLGYRVILLKQIHEQE